MIEPTENNKVSEVFVLVPSYNHSKYIEECLNSIIVQSLAPKKLLVIDDGSSDNSVSIIERVLKDCPFDAELVVRKNRGLCATLNEGFGQSNGEYFAYLGSDDYWMQDFLRERTLFLTQRKDAVLAYGHSLIVDDKGVVVDATNEHREICANYADGNAVQMLMKGIAPVSSTVCYRRAALESLSWNETSKLEDFDMYLQVAKNGEFAFDKRVYSAWRQHANNTSKDDALMLAEVLAAQGRNAGNLSIDDVGVKAARAATTFRFARAVLQKGDKTMAVQLAKQSWAGAESLKQKARFIIRLLVPMSVVRFRKKLREKKLANIGK